MPRFRYEALDPHGRIVSGEVESESIETAREDLHSSKLTVTKITESFDLMSKLQQIKSRFERVNLWALVVFTRQFATIFNSGVPLVRGLEGLSQQTLSRKLSMALAAIYTDVKNGQSLAQSMQKHPDVFSPIYVSLVRAGERAGALGEILDRTASFLERDYNLRKRVQAATTYPIFIFIVTIILTAILVLKVFPTFVDLLQGINVAPPWPTRLLITITTIFTNWAYLSIMFGTFVALAISAYKYVQTSVGERQLHILLLEAPLVGNINKKVIISRFCRTLSTLLSSGVPMINALEIVGRVAGNEIVSEIIDDIKRGLKAGMRLSQPMREYHLFPPLVAHMVSVGEETGNLADVLLKLANFYDNEVEASLNSFTSLIEPLMIGFMGCVVGFVLVAVFMPVYQILQF